MENNWSIFLICCLESSGRLFVYYTDYNEFGLCVKMCVFAFPATAGNKFNQIKICQHTQIFLSPPKTSPTAVSLLFEFVLGSIVILGMEIWWDLKQKIINNVKEMSLNHPTVQQSSYYRKTDRHRMHVYRYMYR